MPFEIIRNDITKVEVDAIVNPTNTWLCGTGGVDGAVHQAAGEELLTETTQLGGCDIGDAKITGGYNLPSRYVIHTVGPIWEGGNKNEEFLLKTCYLSALRLAKVHELETIAFPLISSGTYGYPKDKALSIAISAIGEFLMTHDMMVYLVVYDQMSYELSEKLFSSVTDYLDENYELLDENYDLDDEILNMASAAYPEETLYPEAVLHDEIKSIKYKRNLEDVLEQLDETFSEMLLRLIDEKGKTDSETYKKANIDRRLFSKIRNDKEYTPSKKTVLSFAISLELSLDETKDLLMKSGYALSKSSKFDVIIQYFIENNNYDIFEINEVLFGFEQNLLGV